MLKWLRRHHCPWCSLTTEWAAEGGHLEVQWWAREHHCPWDDDIGVNVAMSGPRNVVLQWIRENADDEVWNGEAEYEVRTNACGPRWREVMAWVDGLNGL